MKTWWGRLTPNSEHATSDGFAYSETSPLVLVLRVLTSLLAVLVNMFPGRVIADGSLDGSWAQVVARGLLSGSQWGVDLVFTYGPLGLLSPFLGYMPDVFLPRLLMQWVFAITFGGLVWVVSRSQSAAGIVITAALLATFGGFLPGDAAWFATYILAAACLWPAVGAGKISLQLLVRLLGVSILPAILPLVKFSLLPIWGAWLLLGGWHIARAHGRRTLPLFLLINLALPLAAWLACGQSLNHLGIHVLRGLQVSLGYTSAMAALPVSPISALIDPLSLSLLGLMIFALIHAHSGLPRLLVTFVLLMSWKSATIRADIAHTAIFPFSAAVALLVMPRSEKRSLMPLAAGLLSAVGLLLSNRHPIELTQFRLAQAMRYAVLPSAWRRDAEVQLEQYAAMAATPAIRAKVGNDSVDVLGDRQGIAYINRLNLKHRPVIQGYSAYSPELSGLNKAFYNDVSRAPQWVMLSLGSIDSRLPLEDDTGATVTVIRNYELEVNESGFLLMHRRATAKRCKPIEWLMPKTIAMMTVLNVPKTYGALWARISAPLTWRGRVQSALTRAPILNIVVTTADGGVHSHRLVPAVAREGFIVSPALENNEDLLRWSSGSRDRAVVSLSIQPAPGDEAAFETTTAVSIAVDQCGLAVNQSSITTNSAPGQTSR